jgi:hypothetical protein
VITALKQLIDDDRVVTWIVASYLLFQLLGVGWDLPGTFGWENDGVAPRDLFGGLAINLTAEHGHRYPLFHYLVLGLFCLPILVFAALGAQGLTLNLLMDAVLTTPVMTSCALIAKLIGLGMSCLALLLLGRIARRTLSTSAGRWAVLFAATNLSFGYYGRATNLDGPYLFWTVFALDRLVAAAADGRRRDYLLLGFSAAAAVATKDQAYASFLLVMPLYLLVLPLFRPFAAGKAHWRLAGQTALVAASAYALLSGALFNPTGYLGRVKTMMGSASQDWRQYPPGLAGVLENLRDLAASQAEFWWPWPLVICGCFGVVLVVGWSALSRAESDQSTHALTAVARPTWRLLPLVAGLSFVLFFTLPVGRCEHRFALPLGFWLAYYGGAAFAWLHGRVSERRASPAGGHLRRLCTAALLACVVIGPGGWQALQLLLTQYGDARRAAVAWLAQLPRGALVETYGHLVYQPHYDFSTEAPYRVQRLTTRPIAQRNPLTGAREIVGLFSAAGKRGADVLLVTEGYVSRFFPPRDKAGQRRRRPYRSAIRARAQQDADAVRFFRRALTGQLPDYDLALHARARLPRWVMALGGRPIEIHGSTGRDIWLLHRKAARTN